MFLNESNKLVPANPKEKHGIRLAVPLTIYQRSRSFHPISEHSRGFGRISPELD
jgi:hypothetical protein